MRSLLMLAILAGFLWMICRWFYSLGWKDAVRRHRRRDDASTAGRKKVESFVVENENGGDDKE